MTAIIELLVEILIYPIAWILCTPFVLVQACFDPGPYFESAYDRYRDVTRSVSRLTSWL